MKIIIIVVVVVIIVIITIFCNERCLEKWVQSLEFKMNLFFLGTVVFIMKDACRCIHFIYAF